MIKMAEDRWRNAQKCNQCGTVIHYAATDEALKHPNNPKWQKQKEAQYKRGYDQIKTNISEMTLTEICEQENIISSMMNALRELSALKGSVF